MRLHLKHFDLSQITHYNPCPYAMLPRGTGMCVTQISRDEMEEHRKRKKDKCQCQCCIDEKQREFLRLCGSIIFRSGGAGYTAHCIVGGGAAAAAKTY